MTPREVLKKRLWFLVSLAYFMLGYMGLNHFTEFRCHSIYTMDLPFERAIPMMPSFIFGYLLIYVSLLMVYFLFDNYQKFKFANGAFLWIMTVHYIFFLFHPVRMVYRPDLSLSPGWINQLTAWYFMLDYPNNCFPSLHVAFPWLGTLLLWNYKRGWAWVFVVMTAIIAASVVLVKQHYILDAAAAIVVTSIVYWLYCRWRAHFTPTPH